MNLSTCFGTVMALAISVNLTAQQAANDSTLQKKLPVQAFAAMPILVGLSAENAFPHEKKYQTIDGNALNLSMKNCQVYSLYGSLPLMKRTKGFAAKINFGYNVFKDNFGAIVSNDSIIASNTDELGSSVITTLHLSQQILFKKCNKKLTLAALYSISGSGITHFETKTQRGTFTATFPLKMTKDNMLVLGIVGVVGKNVKLPILPIVTYFTRLNSHVNVELLFPIFAQLRYVSSARTDVLLGAKIGTRTPFMGLEMPILQDPNDALVFRSQNLRYYLNIEKAVNNYLWFHAEVGYNQRLKEGLNASYVGLSNKIFIGEGGGGYPYAKIGIFIRPVFGTTKTKG